MKVTGVLVDVEMGTTYLGTEKWAVSWRIIGAEIAETGIGIEGTDIMGTETAETGIGIAGIETEGAAGIIGTEIAQTGIEVGIETGIIANNRDDVFRAFDTAMLYVLCHSFRICKSLYSYKGSKTKGIAITIYICFISVILFSVKMQSHFPLPTYNITKF